MSEISANYLCGLETLKQSGVDDSDKRKKSWSDSYGWVLNFGVTVSLSTFFGLWFGNWLDQQLSSAPFCFLLGGVLGLVGSFWGLYRRILSLDKKTKDQQESHDRKVR